MSSSTITDHSNTSLNDQGLLQATESDNGNKVTKLVSMSTANSALPLKEDFTEQITNTLTPAVPRASYMELCRTVNSVLVLPSVFS